MTSLYVDVTQIFTAGRKTQALTGVQRVVLEVAHELCARQMANPVFHDHARRQLYGLPPELLVDGALHDGEARRRLLGTPCKWRDPANYPTAPQRLSRLAASLARGVIHRATTPVGEAATPIRGPLQHPLICPGAPPVSAQVARHAGAGAVALIHDAIPLRTDAARDSFIGRDYLNAFRRMNALGVRYAANSAFTRDDFLAAARASGLPVPSAPIEVILLAAELRDLPSGTDAASFDELPDGPFFLTVGGLDGRKNGRVILEAMCEIARAHGPAALPTLLAAGHNPETPGSLRHEVATSPAFREIAPRIIWATSTSEARLRAAYRGATAMIYPSRFEGFGLPVGEALWLGTPVLASNAASIPEAGGELAEYFSPDDPQELAQLMWRLIDSPDHAAVTRKRIAAAKPHLRTWADVAEDFAGLARR